MSQFKIFVICNVHVEIMLIFLFIVLSVEELRRPHHSRRTPCPKENQRFAPTSRSLRLMLASPQNSIYTNRAMKTTHQKALPLPSPKPPPLKKKTQWTGWWCRNRWSWAPRASPRRKLAPTSSSPRTWRWPAALETDTTPPWWRSQWGWRSPATRTAAITQPTGQMHRGRIMTATERASGGTAETSRTEPLWPAWTWRRLRRDESPLPPPPP